ncbi:MAG: NAD(P)/FAD-dependent oxidoreductase [Bacteroidia bacterium]|nr:NAD(P)/FAD-dependent oxidoreductase [Bacteroidia bacterium]
MIQSYKQKLQLEDQYDTIIIGSGMGALAAGALLSKEGQKVLILERHYTPGGFTHVFKRKGYEWDVGIHYIGEVSRPNSALRKMFDYISDGKLQWADMGEVYDRIIIGDRSYDLVKGVKNFRDKMVSYFPDESKAIDQYIDLVFQVSKSAGKFYMDKALPNLASRIIGGRMRKAFYKFSDQTTYGILRSLTENEELIKVLSAQYGDYGLPPKQSSFAMHASVVKHYFHGGSFPIGGSAEIVNTVDPVIESASGTILISAEVDKIIIENNTAKGVRMKDGKTFMAKTIISGAGIYNTYEKMISNSVSEKHGLRDHLQKLKPSVAHGCLYIGLKGSPEELQLPKTNLWIYPGDLDHDSCVRRYAEDISQPFPVVYISFPAAKDPSWSERYPGRSTIDIITLLPYEIFQQWEGTRWMKRGDDYKALKEKISQRLLEHLFDHQPHLRDHIDHYELSTPLTTQNFVNYKNGEIYGIDHTPSRFRQKFLRPRTPIKGLYLTGQDVVTAGIGGALFAGLITASAITGVNFMKKIFA